MTTNIYLSSGEKLYLEYSFKQEIAEIKPFSYLGEKIIYMNDGNYILKDGSEMIIKDKIIWRINKK